MAEGTILAIVQIISAYTVAPVGRQFGYLFYYNRNIRKLSSGVKKLGLKRDGVIIQVDEAKNNCHVIESEVENWLNLVAQKMEEASLVLIDKENIRKGCFNEWCLNLKPRHSLSRRATKTTQDLIVLLGEANFQRVSHPPPPPAKVLEPVSDNMTIASTSTSKSGGFQSRLSILEGVMKAVRDDDIHVVGICGMGGVGKTTMVEDVERRAREELLFEEILMVVVGQDQDEKRIQSTIAENMRMELGADDLLVRAKVLRQRLSIKGSDGKSKKTLIILDDLWRKLDLKKVGIPSKDEHASCKIILTTRSRDVCSHMEAQPFDVPVMNFDEACDLFKSSIQTTTMHPNWKDIVKECGGLPIAITIIAMMLRDKGEYTWNHVLGQLKKSSLKGEHANVYDVFRVSYDYIKDEEITDIFLLCCLYPEDEDIPIEDLVRNGWGLRVFKDVDKLHEARAAAHAHVEVL